MKWTARGLALLALAVGGWAALQVRAGRLADRFFDGDPAVVLPLADAVAAAVAEGTDPARFHTGSDRFDGEWALVTCQMALIGLAQVADAHPERRSAYAGAAAGCVDYLLDPAARAFGTDAWGEDGLSAAALASDHGHAYLGWLGLGLRAGLRLVTGEVAARARPVADAVADALARRMAALPVAAFETYPGETYPPDLALVAAAVAESHRHDAAVAAFAAKHRAAAVDPATGLLVQALDPRTGAPADAVRGSAPPWPQPPGPTPIARSPPTSPRRRAARCGRAWPAAGACARCSGAPGRMDVDSGPVLFGLGVSASGFGLADARLLGDRDLHRSLFRSAHAAGVPVRGWFWTGGGLGNALLLAMLTGGDAWGR
ncbi:MAG: hypothetical protein R3F59_15570 [Myxococcota bacterium]